MDRPTIAMLWMRGRLSWLELLCMRSFMDAGHPLVLYSYEPLANPPAGAELRDATEIATENGLLVHPATGSPAQHSDHWRYRLLARHPELIWADADAYCLRPFRTWDGHLHGWESESDVNVGVLALPEGSDTLAGLIAHTSDAFAMPPWVARYKGAKWRALREAAKTGAKVHASEQPWGVWGPHALTHFLHETGEVRHSRPQEVLYPYSFAERRKMLRPGYEAENPHLTQDTLSVHLYGRRMRRVLVEKHGGLPHPESLLGEMLARHRLDPMKAPLRDMPESAETSLRAQHYKARAETPRRAPMVRPLDTVVAVTTMRNEGAFILDWVAYHRAVGVTHFLVYTNDCDDPTNAILDALASRGLVTRIDNPATGDERPQRVALALAGEHPVVTGADAVVVMDVDEYVNVHVGDGTLGALFEAAGDPDMISMTWRLFGSNGRVGYDETPVPLAFTRAALRETRKPHHAWGMKTIFRRGVPFAELGVHRPRAATGPMPRWVNGSGAPMPESYLEDGWRSTKKSWGYDLVTLNHYAVRSVESYLVKRDRGRTNHIRRPLDVEYWNTFNRNDCDDASIVPRWEAAEAERAALMADPALAALHAEAVDWHRARIAGLKADAAEGALFAHLAEAPLRHDLPPFEPGPPGRVAATVAPFALREETPLTGGEADDAFRALMARVQPKQRLLTPLASPPPAERITIVTSMKNEGAFILEWVAYHLSIGVTHFLVYTNDCEDPTNAILDRLAEHGIVTRVDNPFNRAAGQKPQRGALNDAVARIGDADWVGIIDVDEFVNIHVGDGTFGALLGAAGDPNIISMTWRFFGNRDVHGYEDRWQTETFTDCAPLSLPKPRLGWGFKSFHRVDAPYAKLGVHRPLELDEDRVGEVRWVNGAGRVMPERVVRKAEWFSRKDTVGYDLVTLNHYVLRSAESFLVKRERGRINHVDQDQGVAYWAARNYATETDTSIHRHLPRAKARLAELQEDETLADLHAQATLWHRLRIATLMGDPDYRALYDAITDPTLPDAIWRAPPARVDVAAE